MKNYHRVGVDQEKGSHESLDQSQTRREKKPWPEKKAGMGNREGAGEIGAGGLAHGWYSWGRSSPCEYSHIGNCRGRSGHRHPGSGTDSNNRD